MRLPIAMMATAAAISAWAWVTAADAATVQIRDAAARVTVIPEDRTDVKVEFLTTNSDLPIEIRTVGADTVLDGHLGHRLSGCGGEHRTVHVLGIGAVSYDNLPQVVIRTPKAVALEAGGVVYGTIGRSASLELQNHGCGVWTVADVAGPAVLQESGVGAVKMGAMAQLDVHLSGTGDVHATRVQGLQASLSGAGNITIDDFSGPMQAHVSGVGKIRVLNGHADSMNAAVSGVGSVDFEGQADSLAASISGFGGIRVKTVSGPVSKSISGGGHVTIGDRS